MYRKDYILRLVEEAAKMLAKAMGLKEKGDYPKALDEIEEAYSGILKVDPQEVHNTSSIIELIDKIEEGKIEKTEALADFLALEGEIKLLKGNKEEAVTLLNKALDCLHYVDEESHIFSFERQARIVEIESILNAN